MASCPHLQEGKCAVASKLAGLPVLTTEEMCHACTNWRAPQQENKWTASLAITTLSDAKKQIPPELFDITVDPGEGPGTELHRLLGWINLGKNCGTCNRRAAQMNEWGIVGCRANEDTIMQWLKEAAEVRGLPFFHAIGKAAFETAMGMASLKSKKEGREQDALVQLEEPEPHEEQPPLDFVWVYWAGGAKNDELRWSMRSVKKYYPNSTLWLVGDKPAWYTGNHIHVDRVPQQPRRGFRDVLNKIWKACQEDRIADDFIWMMDDIYFVQNVGYKELTTPRYRKYVGKKVSREPNKNGWLELKRATLAKLVDSGFDNIHDYCTHLPQFVNKYKFMDTWDRFELGERVLQWELCYGAMHWTPQGPQKWTPFFRRLSSASHVTTIPKEAKVINNTDGGWSEQLRAFLWNRFPDTPDHEDPDALPPAPPIWENSKPIVNLRYNFEIKEGYQDRLSNNEGISTITAAQQNVYQFAKEIAPNAQKILDLGTGNGEKLMQHFGDRETVGTDVLSQVKRCRHKFPDSRWEVAPHMEDADLVICADVIEHVDRPDLLLTEISKQEWKHLVISTPERDICRGKDDMGPPENPRHCREWNTSEFVEFITKFIGPPKQARVLDRWNLVVHVER